MTGGIKSEILGPILNKYLFNKKDYMLRYINNLLDVEKGILLGTKMSKKLDVILMAKIIISLEVSDLHNLCLSNFLLVYTYQDGEEVKQFASLPVSIRIGKRMFSIYINNLKYKYIKDTKEFISYTLWLEKWKENNPELYSYLDDRLYAELGCKILDILMHSELLDQVLIKTADKEYPYHALKVKDKNLMSDNSRLKVINLPLKLPMVCPPKIYTSTSLGGYCLNDEKFADQMFIEKKAYALKSELTGSKLYSLVNDISNTPFKINQPLLDYINTESDIHNLLIDINAKHKYEDLEKMTKYQKSSLASHKSKVVLQETILGLAEFYSNFSKIYFPVRLDQRGRLYCSPSYLNYQSNELSKALILFAEPGIIRKENMSSMIYLNAYGVNCYCGSIKNTSLKSKSDWVDKNVDNIINYDNGILLSKANDKLLFLAFCMEYKRFYDFYTNENQMEFKTYLPIQLDATCNGFQDMAFLSNENELFKELNLVSDSSKVKDKDNILPGDFYNFLLHKLTTYFKCKVDSGILYDDKAKVKNKSEKEKGSFERLQKFIWNRAQVKKSIMTIPYNSSSKSMKNYLASSLYLTNCNKDDTLWYSPTEKDTKNFINLKDLYLLISCLKYIIDNDFEKIKKLRKYLRNVATLLNALELPITWTLPTGLTIKQSYLKTDTTSITPFMSNKSKLTLKVTLKGKYDKNKQVRSLMPNLIHSLDGTSLSLLYEQFKNTFHNKPSQLYSVHDCFGTTCDKVPLLKTILAVVYTDLYSSDPYLHKFDKSILDSIEVNTDLKVDRLGRKVTLQDGNDYSIHDLDWVLNKKQLSSKFIKKIDSQNILI